jgi:hypothetical protein
VENCYERLYDKQIIVNFMSLFYEKLKIIFIEITLTKLLFIIMELRNFVFVFETNECFHAVVSISKNGAIDKIVNEYDAKLNLLLQKEASNEIKENIKKLSMSREQYIEHLNTIVPRIFELNNFQIFFDSLVDVELSKAKENIEKTKQIKKKVRKYLKPVKSEIVEKRRKIFANSNQVQKKIYYDQPDNFIEIQPSSYVTLPAVSRQNPLFGYTSLNNHSFGNTSLSQQFNNQANLFDPRSQAAFTKWKKDNNNKSNSIHNIKLPNNDLSGR